MPEILTKHPDIVLQVLASQGARCGPGVQPKILTSCPADRFCSLAGGEVCVFGPNELGAMTQLAPAQLCSSSAPAAGALVPGDRPGGDPSQLYAISVPLGVAVVVVGLVGFRRRRKAL